ncbi:hypothetical protein MPSEU_000294900 [Mayamaea pseudoterrestris]|nr:hypothetical protein MPSEU_000294900 [Mayamaea pseudoterrestris]
MRYNGPKKEASISFVIPIISFVLGCLLSATLVLNVKVASTFWFASHSEQPPQRQEQSVANAIDKISLDNPISQHVLSSSGSVLQGLRVLVAIAAFDFSQIPHLEEVIDGYHDLCTAGAIVHVEIHATVPYPVTLIDLWNTRLTCENFQLYIVLKNKSLRLHLVDCHRKLFYDNIHDYDLFIYSEDDIRLTPSVVATYVKETKRVERILADSEDAKPSDFNVGIVRYEYNYPANVVIDDNTRHATMNVTRVYWEHSNFERPVVPNCVVPLEQRPFDIQERYVTMKNHHQGMYLATRELLLAWKDRPHCEFDRVRDRPGVGAQPTEGTQRVWMSSQMLYGNRHCNVQQVIPRDKFGALTVLHLPNKNYRRVGKYRNRKFADGTEVFEAPSDKLLTAMELHLGIVQGMPPRKPQFPYKGITMVDDVDKAGDRSTLLERRLKEYNDYVKRGGVLSAYDLTRTVLVEDE